MEDNIYMGPTQTTTDAEDRIWCARSGFLGGNPTIEYLQALKRELISWEFRVNAEIAILTLRSKQE